MKKLLLLRHAKSDWNDFTLEDHERPLNERGKRNASQIGRYMADHNLTPDMIFCSTAIRTRETLGLILEETPLTCPIEFRPDIYEATSRALMDIIKSCPDKYHHIMLVGHNPAMQYLGLELSNNLDGKHRQQLEKHLPTGTLQCHTLNLDSFESVSENSSILDRLIRPKTLPE